MTGLKILNGTIHNSTKTRGIQYNRFVRINRLYLGIAQKQIERLTGSNRGLLRRFVKHQRLVSSIEECQLLCLDRKRDANCEVFEVEYWKASPSQMKCKTSTVRA